MKIFYHTDTDGISAAAIVLFKVYALYKYHQSENAYLTEEQSQLLEEYETRSICIPAEYSSSPVNPFSVIDGEEVYIVDYSFSEKTVSSLVEICKKAKNVIWLDHHLTSKKVQDSGLVDNIPNLTYHIDMNMSGAMLAWSYEFSRINYPRFVQLIDDYDRWVHAYGDETRNAHIGFDMNSSDPYDTLWTDLISDWIYKNAQDYKYGEYFLTEVSNRMYQVLNDGRIAYKYIMSDNKRYYDTYHFVNTIDGITCDCVNRRTNSWIFGDEYSKYPLHCVFGFDGSCWKYSLYSGDPDVDCSAIAEKFGGGGHKGAAGFSLPYCLFSQNN